MLSQDPIESLIASAKAGSSHALGQLLERCRPYLLLAAHRELNGRVQAKLGASDVVQETFIEAQRHFSRFVGTTQEELFRWLRHILVNNIRDALRAYHHTGRREIGREMPWDEANTVSEGLSDPETPSWFARMNERNRRLREALESIPSDYRDVIVLRNFELLSFVEIGKLMNRSPDAVRKLWRRAIDALARELDDDRTPQL